MEVMVATAPNMRLNDREDMIGNCSGPLRVVSPTCTVDARTVENSTPRSHS
jgi:hypothetical protein